MQGSVSLYSNQFTPARYCADNVDPNGWNFDSISAITFVVCHPTVMTFLFLTSYFQALNVRFYRSRFWCQHLGVFQYSQQVHPSDICHCVWRLSTVYHKQLVNLQPNSNDLTRYVFLLSLPWLMRLLYQYMPISFMFHNPEPTRRYFDVTT